MINIEMSTEESLNTHMTNIDRFIDRLETTKELDVSSQNSLNILIDEADYLVI